MVEEESESSKIKEAETYGKLDKMKKVVKEKVLARGKGTKESIQKSNKKIVEPADDLTGQEEQPTVSAAQVPR